MAKNKFGGNCIFCNKYVPPLLGTRRKPGFLGSNTWSIYHEECHNERKAKIRATQSERQKNKRSASVKEGTG